MKACVSNYHAQYENYKELKNRYIDQMSQLQEEGKDMYFERGIPAERH